MNKIFSGEENIPEAAKPGRSEYLRADIKPIMACIGTPADFEDYPGPTAVFDGYRNAEENNNAHHVDYRASGTYVMSPVDKQDKFSDSFRNCTGLLVAGQDKNTGGNISFLSHESPRFFLLTEEYKNEFIADLEQRLEEIRERCVDGTIDARIVGGNYFTKEKKYMEDYLESIKLLSSEVSKVLGFEPIVVTGPKTLVGNDDVYYDNEHRRLYIVRPKVGNATSESFVLKDLEEQKKKW
ncbi:MAG: hypothetical protein AAB621_03145 [Patescibacteria group bacterium]